MIWPNDRRTAEITRKVMREIVKRDWVCFGGRETREFDREPK